MAKTHQVLWTDTAQQDLTGIIDYIAQDSVENALVILDKLEAKAGQLATLPNRGRIVPELLHTGISQYREIISAPWRIVYRIESQRVLVMAVLDSRRDLQVVLLNRLAH
ncbi:MAG TPA: plasmid stabilization protein [Gallionella sp.]|nr:type II toxin-antitoxin system RelE/ParE family toxin [Gallionella sp.]OGS66836.1 MAG: plasmid stabilization protein [Gallionellales bacterium GWA2_54_124]OGT20900.1 MAG: plasmid stabilization protein [Gallionellales bacterium RIFOXYD12_FULL_53_10]HCI53803.1 plasmid stabilization protein [Gallionella sp.]